MPDLEELTDPEMLGARLRSILRDVSSEGISVGVMVGEHVAVAGFGAGIQTGCATKLLTSAMMCEAIAHGHFDLDGELEKPLDSVTPRQLLEHTHGFDDSVLEPLQFRRDGFIDTGALWEVLQSAPPLAAPGEQYNYGNGGALLAAAVLEKVQGSPFPQLLSAHLGSLGVAIAEPEAATCPATGASIAISVTGFLRFLMHQACLGRTDSLERETRALPGWHPTERGISRGWKSYGAGWFGHNSEVPGHGLLVRLNPRERIAIVVASGDHPPAAIASALFRKHLPGLVRLEMPRLNSERSVGSEESARLRGIYANGAVSVRIDANDESELRLRMANSRTGRMLIESARLHPAQDRIFFLHPPALEYFPFVQFVGESRYLWTGSQTLQRVSGTK
jgi:CubicO group peptidase (beta-lactamase class C family)